MRDTPLPIDDCLPDLVSALRARGVAVLEAPPGAGKTTRVPLALLAARQDARDPAGTDGPPGRGTRGGKGTPLIQGRIVMLEPRRLAVRAAAERMAAQLGEEPGQTVGYRMRGEARVGPATRIEVVTEGILTRMIQSDPELAGIGALIFDEFHERSLNADLGLALAWEVRGALRPDLAILVMSATLDAAPVAALLDAAPTVTSQGRSFPVGTRWLDRPLPAAARFEGAVADLVARAVAETEGGVLVFLPGEGEIRRTAAQLAGRLPRDCVIRPLYGALPFAAQRAAIAPSAENRKVVLATAIAETSLTIEDIRVVVDAGRARRARFDPGSGMSRLVTERVTRAEAAQRAGRAGRVAPGTCYRLWTRGEEGAQAAFPPAEIEAADLAPLALELALWGSDRLAFLTPPPQVALDEARALLEGLGALDPGGGITPHGRALAALPLHPRLGHMLLRAGPQAAPLAALLSDRDVLRGAPVDLGLRLAALEGRAGAVEAPRAALDRIRQEARRLARAVRTGGTDAWDRKVADAGGGSEEEPAAGDPGETGAACGLGGDGAGSDRAASAAHGGDAARSRNARNRSGRATAGSPAGNRDARAADSPRLSTGEMAALAYPDRIGLRRPGDAPRYILSGGKGAVLPAADPLAGQRLIVATDLDGDTREAAVRQAASLTESELRGLYADCIIRVELCEWSRRDRRVVARRQERLGALVLEDAPWPDAPPEAVARAMLDGVRDLGLRIEGAAALFRARVELVRAGGTPLPDMSDAALLDSVEDWLLPHLQGVRSADDWRRFDLSGALRAMLDWQATQELDRAAPAHFTTPLGRKVAIDYGGEAPGIALRLQEMFGVTTHPVAAGLPLRVSLLSPAGRPVQVTTDIPGFWANSYADVRKEMRGRYPRHPWPEDPTAAQPTLRAKPRG